MTEQLGLNAADVALIVGMVQCGLIAWGIRSMREGNKGRDVLIQSLERQTASLDQTLASQDRQESALARILEQGH